MSETDRELFESALRDAPPDEPAATPPVPAEPEAPAADPVRDPATGRFAPRQADQAPERVAAEPQPVAEPAPPPAGDHRVPLRELLDERERRQDLQRRLTDHEAQLRRLQTAPPRERPDPFANPEEFLQHGVSEAVSPLHSEVRKLREYYSEQLAAQKFGQDTIKQAYDAMGDALSQRDPDAWAVYQRAMDSMDPYGVLVSWHRKNTTLKQVGEDPVAWFERQLEERIKDPAQQAQLLERIRGNVASPNGAGNTAPNVKLPPSLNKFPSAAPRMDDDLDASDAGLFRYALR